MQFKVQALGLALVPSTQCAFVVDIKGEERFRNLGAFFGSHTGNYHVPLVYSLATVACGVAGMSRVL